MEFRVFFSCYETKDSVDASTPYSTDRENMISMAQQILRDDGDYFGILDENDVTLQIMMQGANEARMEIPIPADGGSYGKRINIADLEKVLLALEPPFTVSKFDGFVFEKW